MPLRIKAVLFDWDGVLLDSLEENIRVYNKILRRIGLKPLSREKFMMLQSPNWYLFYRRLGIPERMWKLVDREWLTLYGFERPKLHLGVKTALKELKKVGVKTGLVTNGERSRVEREVRAFGVGRYLDALIFRGSTRELKPSPLMVMRALRELKVSPKKAIYVGDSPEDILAAKAAGVTSVAISGGLSQTQRLVNERPDYLFTNLKDMMETLFN